MPVLGLRLQDFKFKVVHLLSHFVNPTGYFPEVERISLFVHQKAVDLSDALRDPTRFQLWALFHTGDVNRKLVLELSELLLEGLGPCLCELQS